MKTFTTYTSYREAAKIAAYLTANNIRFSEWHDPDGYEIQATVTAEQYNELEAL